MDEVSKKVKCKNENCQKMILEVTAQKTGGYCYPCYNAIQAEEREEYIRKNRRDINPYDGVEDPAEILKIMHQKREYDPLITYIKYPKSRDEVYNLLSDSEVNELKKHAFKLYDENNDEWESILLHLVCLKNAEINDFLKVLIKNDEISYSSLFFNASDEIAQLLIDKLNNNKNSVNVNHILKCLATIGNERIVKLFNRWKNNEPEFAKVLYVKPYDYSFEGGFTIDENGNRKNLYYDKAYSIKIGQVPGDTPVSFYDDIRDDQEFSNTIVKDDIKSQAIQDNDFSKKSKKCGCCKKDLKSLFTIDLKDDSMNFMGVNGDKLKIATCSECVCYDTIFTEIDTEGNAYWSEYNNSNDEQDIYEDEYDETEPDENKKVYLDTIPKNSDYAADCFLDVRFTKIGGRPTWVNDAYFPKCPKCGEHMMFVGQVSGEDLDNFAEGITYGFVCKQCMIAATTYQQT